MKRFLFFIASITLSLAATANGVKIGYFNYIIDQDAQTATVTYTGATAYSSDNTYAGDLIVPDSVEYNDRKYPVFTIGRSAFHDCTALTSIVLPPHLDSIGSYAFENCDFLSAITMPLTDYKIGYMVFNGCGLLPIEFGIRYAGTYIISLINRDSTSVVIKDGTKAIADGAFANSKLTSICLPSSIIYIGDTAFHNCPNLSSVICLSETPPAVGYGGSGLMDGTPLYVPEQSVATYQSNPQWEKLDVRPLSVIVHQSTPDSAQIFWAPVDSATRYELHIESVDPSLGLDTTLVLLADGDNGGILPTAEPAIHRQHKIVMDEIGTIIVITIEPNSGTSAANPIRFNVSNISNESVEIAYEMTAFHNEEILTQEEGTITLSEPESTVQALLFAEHVSSTRLYDLQGRGYPAEQYPSLPAGIYIIQEDGINKKIIK